MKSQSSRGGPMRYLHTLLWTWAPFYRSGNSARRKLTGRIKIDAAIA